MTSTAFVADVHLGNHKRFGGKTSAGLNRRFQLVAQALADALEVASARGAEQFVVLGDLFDTAKPSPAELAAVMRVFSATDLEVRLLLGNHDQSSPERGDNALAPLGFLPNVRVYDYAAGRAGTLILVPFQPGPAVEWLRASLSGLELAGPSFGSYTLAVHLGIGDEKTPAFLRGANDSITVDELLPLMREFGICTVCAGNWHDPRQWEIAASDEDPVVRRIYQVGALAPTGFDNPGESYGRMLIFDKRGRLDTVRVATRPRFYTLSFEDGDVGDLRERTDKPFVKVTARVKNLAAARAELEELRVAGKIEDFIVLPDREVVIAAAHSAAKAARSATTVSEAVERYVEKMPIDGGVSRAGVLEVVRRYLG